MDVLKKYGLTFYKSNIGSFNIKMTPINDTLELRLVHALEDFHFDIEEILQNAVLYKKVLAENPMEHNQKGVISDEEYYKYWGVINEIEHNGCNTYSVSLYKDTAYISYYHDPNHNNDLKIPLDDWIEILKECIQFRNTTY